MNKDEQPSRELLDKATADGRKVEKDCGRT